MPERAQSRRKLRPRPWPAAFLLPGVGVANLLAQTERLWTNLQGLGVRRLVALGFDRRHDRRCRRPRRIRPQPAGHGDALFRPRPRRRGRHRRGAARGGGAVRRQRRGDDRARVGRAGLGRADDPRREGAAARRGGRQRAVRQARLARPHLVHAGRDAAPRARRRACAHDPDDALGQGRARPHRARRRRLVPPRAPALLGVGGDPHRRRRRPHDRRGDPAPCRLRRPGHEDRRRDRAQRRRAASGVRLGFDRQGARQPAHARDARCRRRFARASRAR